MLGESRGLRGYRELVPPPKPPTWESHLNIFVKETFSD